jgi:hypothetical protein
VGAHDDAHPVRPHPSHLAAADRVEGVAGEIRLLKHPGEQVAGGAVRPGPFKDGQIPVAEEVTRPAAADLPELEARLGEHRQPGPLTGVDDAVLLVCLLDEALEVGLDRLGVAL